MCLMSQAQSIKPVFSLFLVNNPLVNYWLSVLRVAVPEVAWAHRIFGGIQENVGAGSFTVVSVMKRVKASNMACGRCCVFTYP